MSSYIMLSMPCYPVTILCPCRCQSLLCPCRCHVIQSLCSTGLESTYSLYPSLSKFLCLLEIEEASMVHNPTTTADSDHNPLPFLLSWKDRLSHLDSDFQFVEPVLAVRGSVLHRLLQVGANEAKADDMVVLELKRRVEVIFKALSDTLLTHSRWAREAANYQVSYVT